MSDRKKTTYVISVAAELAGMHPQTLRQYDRLGIVIPARTKGRGRRYTPRDVERLREVQRLSQDEGVNLEGIRQILDLKARLDEASSTMDRMRAELEHLALRFNCRMSDQPRFAASMTVMRTHYVSFASAVVANCLASRPGSMVRIDKTTAPGAVPPLNVGCRFTERRKRRVTFLALSSSLARPNHTISFDTPLYLR